MSEAKPAVCADVIVCGWQARLYPTPEQSARLNGWAGSLRFLWNRLLDAEKAEYAATKRFLWRKQLQPIAVAMKREPGLEWLADLPAHAVLDCVARLDCALGRMVSERKAGRKCGFPKPKKKFVREAGIYCVAQASTVDGQQAVLPKLGRVALPGGDMPQGRLLASRVWRDGDRWMLPAQFECARPEPMLPTGLTLGGDLGVSTLITTFDGAAFEEVLAPKPLRRAQRRLKRAQRKLARRQKGSNRRRDAARRVGVIHLKVRCIRQDALHQVSHRLTDKADVLKLETLNVAGMARNHRIALSIADAGMGSR